MCRQESFSRERQIEIDVDREIDLDLSVSIHVMLPGELQPVTQLLHLLHHLDVLRFAHREVVPVLRSKNTPDEVLGLVQVHVVTESSCEGLHGHRVLL